MPPASVRAAGASAALYVSDSRARVVEASANAGSVRYDVVRPDGVLLMVLRVSWLELGGGVRRVTLSVHGQQLVRRRAFGRLVGCAVVPDCEVAGLFAQELQSRLAHASSIIHAACRARNAL